MQIQPDDHRVGKMLRWQFRLRTLLLFLCASCLVMATVAWYFSPRQRISRLLAELADQPGGHIDLTWSGRPWNEIDSDFRALGSSAVPHLIEALHSPDPSIRYLAAGRLGATKDLRGVDPLIICLQSDRDEIVRTWAAVALGEIGDRRAVRPLLDYLEEPGAAKRWCAVQALGRIGDKKATQPILKFLDDENLYMRAHAAQALGFLDHALAIDPLITVLQTEPDDWVRGMAVESLGRIRNDKAHAALVAALQDDSERVSSVVKDALAEYSRTQCRSSTSQK